MDSYQMAYSTGGNTLHIARDGATLCTPKYAPDNFEATGTLAQTKRMVNTLGAMRPCEDCIDRAHEILEADGGDDAGTDQEDIMGRTYTTDADIRDMVVEVLEASDAREGTDAADDFDIDAITGELMEAADYDGRKFVGIPEGDEFWTIVARHDVSEKRQDGADAHLAEANEAHGDLQVLEQQVSATRGVRDDAIRAAIAEGVTMYAIAKRLGITEQAVRRIRDRG